jgi:hypothetical protein
MKLVSKLLMASMALVAGVAFAQPGPPPGGAGAPPSERGDPRQPRDCGKVPAERQKFCEARNKAVEKCKAKTERDEHRKCMMDNMPKREGEGKGNGKGDPAPSK